MKKAIAILLTALLLLTVFVSCEGDIEDMFGKTVSFNGNGSTSGQMAEMKVKKGEEVTLPANEFTRTDYVFAGWNTQADGSGTGYADKAKASFDDNTVLYAQWAEELTITFNANDGSGTMDPVKVSAGVYKLPENVFTAPEGYALFVRWSETADGEVEYEVGDELEVTKDVTLYAIWAKVLPTTPGDLNGRYTITANTPIDNRFGASGTLKLYLPDGLTLNAKKGIQVTTGCTLIINKLGTDGNGTLLIDNVDDNEAGIGGENYGEKRTAGEIIINGGTVNATGGYGGAGIGGGYQGAGGTVTINGGTVTATVRDSAAGIGGGYEGAGGTVTINGGIVTAIGGVLEDNYGGAGIGGGYQGAGETVTINGGTVTAKGGGFAAGIGGAYYRAGATVIITGGTVTANGGKYAAGIGGGFNGNGGTVAINGGTVIANGNGGGAGIGGGNDGGKGGEVTINGGTVTATGGSANEYHGPGAGIGGGAGGDGGTVAINGGTVTATGGSGSDSIGIGAGSNNPSHGTLEIGTRMALYGDSTSPAQTKRSDATESYTGDRYRYMLAKQPGE